MEAEAILDALPDGVVVVGPDRRIHRVNPRACRLLGLTSEALLGREVVEALPLLDPAGRPWWDCLDPWGGLAIRTGHRERLLTLPDGAGLLVAMRFVRPRRGAPVEWILVGLRDTEPRRRSEASTAELLSIVAHELRSPLSSVRSFSGTLVRRWDRFTEGQRRLMVETISADANRLSRLLNELLDVSRLDSNRLRVAPVPLDLREVVTKHVVRLVRSGHDRDRFAWWESDAGRREVWADADRLDQILANLVENALRHGAGTVSIATREMPESGLVEVTVSDEGEGIDPALYPLIFQKFWHGSARGSTGLGLYLVKGLVEAHGGTVAVDRAPGGGARFRFTLPTTEPLPA